VLRDFNDPDVPFSANAAGLWVLDDVERITASPAISGNELFYRTDSHVFCIVSERRTLMC